MFALP
jgi:superoxide dismutase, Fe-Mn family